MQWVNIICFILISNGLLALFSVQFNDFLAAISRRRAVTLVDELAVLLGIPAKGFFNRDYEIEQILKDTDRTDKFELVKNLSLLLFAAGAVLALLVNNIYLVPILGIGFSLIPVWYLRSTAGVYKKHLNEELETAISIITTSYVRTEDLIRSVKENLPFINDPVKVNFETFVYEAENINANLTSVINSLKMRVPNLVFHEWCNALIQCQSDRSMKNTLPIIIRKFSDIRIVQSELEATIHGPRREAFTMMFIVVSNVPLLYFLNKDWFNALVFTTPGKIVLAVCAAIILFELSQIMKLSKPIEYGGSSSMIILVLLTCVFLGVAAYNLSCAFAQVPTGRTSKMMLLSRKQQGVKNDKLPDIYITRIAAFFEKFVKLDKLKRSKLQATLAIAGIEVSPEVYTLKAFVTAVLAALCAFPVSFIQPLFAMIVIGLAVTLWFSTYYQRYRIMLFS